MQLKPGVRQALWGGLGEAVLKGERYLHAWIGHDAKMSACKKTPISEELWAEWLAADNDLVPTDRVAWGDDPSVDPPFRLGCPGSGRWSGVDPFDIVFTLQWGRLSIYRDTLPMYLLDLPPVIRAKAEKIAAHLGAGLHETWLDYEDY